MQLLTAKITEKFHIMYVVKLWIMLLIVTYRSVLIAKDSTTENLGRIFDSLAPLQM